MNYVDSTFIELLSARSIRVEVESKSALDSLRIMMYRRLLSHISELDAVGYLDESLRDSTITVKVEKNSNQAVLSIIKRKPRLQFKILPPPGTSDHETVPANLEHDQDCKIQHGSTSSDSQGYGANVDSGSPQGESNGQRVAAEDWESQLRAFVESDSDSQD